MILTNQIVYSKATYRKGKIKGASNGTVTVTFYNDVGINIKLDKFLDYVLCSKEVEEEIRRRINELQAIQE